MEISRMKRIEPCRHLNGKVGRTPYWVCPFCQVVTHILVEFVDETEMCWDCAKQFRFVEGDPPDNQ